MTSHKYETNNYEREGIREEGKMKKRKSSRPGDLHEPQDLN